MKRINIHIIPQHRQVAPIADRDCFRVLMYDINTI